MEKNGQKITVGPGIREAKNVWGVMGEMKTLAENATVSAEVRTQLGDLLEELNYALRLLTWKAYRPDADTTLTKALLEPTNRPCPNGPPWEPVVGMLGAADFAEKIQYQK